MSRLTALVSVLFLGFAWGVSFSLSKIIVKAGLAYTSVTAAMMIMVCIGMIVVAIIRRKPPKITLRHLLFYGLCAVLGYLTPTMVGLYAIGHLDVSIATLLATFAPITTLLFALFMKTDFINIRRIFGITVGTVAIFIIVLPAVNTEVGPDLYWLGVYFLIPISYGLYHNYVAKYWPEDSDTFQVACGESILAMVISLTLVFVIDVDTGVGLFDEWGIGQQMILLMTALTLIEIFLYFELIRRLGPVHVAQADYVMVVSGVLCGMVIFSEEPTGWLWLSVGLIMFSLFLIEKKKEN